MTSSPDEFLSQVSDVLDALHAGAALIDRGGRIIHANPRLCRMLQREPADVVGRYAQDLYPPGEPRDEIKRALEEFGLARERESFLPLPDGGRLPVMSASRSLGSEPPNADYAVVTMLDISALKDAENGLRQQYETITQLSDTVLEQALELKDYSKTLEERVRQRTRELREANLDAVTMLAVAAEARDTDTGAHVQRIRSYSTSMARAIGLSESDAERIGYSSILHDVGKLHIPDEILKKPGPLTDGERKRMELHTVVGQRILSKKPFFEQARQIARSHHENHDGSGYPDGLGADQISLAARIVHLVDVFDALTSRRVYKPPWPPGEAVEAIVGGSGTQFDPELVKAFKSLVDSDQWARIREDGDVG